MFAVRLPARSCALPRRALSVKSAVSVHFRPAAYNAAESISPQEREAVMKVINPWEQQGEERGIRVGEERGIRIGEERASRAILMRLLTRKFGQLPGDIQEQIGSLSQDKLEQLADALLEFAALEDVRSWLTQKR